MTIKKEFFAGTYVNEACQEAVDLAIASFPHQISHVFAERFKK